MNEEKNKKSIIDLTQTDSMILSAISFEYAMIGIIDLTSGEFVIRNRRSNFPIPETAGAGIDYDTIMLEFSDRFVYEEDRIKFSSSASIKGILMSMEFSNSHIVKYRVNSGDRHIWHESRFIGFISDDDRPMVILCVRNLGTENEVVVSNEITTESDNRIFVGMKVLLVDDDDFTRQINREILELEGAFVTEASGGEEAVRIYRESESFDLVLVDVIMPGIDGCETTRRLREIETVTGRNTPIMAVSSDKRWDTVRNVTEAGADACLQKPLSTSELSKVLIQYMRMRTVAMKRKYDDALRMARTDSLTHVKNVTAYTDKIAEINANIHYGREQSFAVVMIDINNLKKENDTYGHSSGDIYIKNCCRLVCEVFDHSPVYRVGGDEFIVIVQNKDYEDIGNLLSELDKREKEASLLPDAASGRASFAFGMAVFSPDSDKSFSDVIKRADSLMYADKKIKKETDNHNTGN